jgi:hypothetical protein
MQSGWTANRNRPGGRGGSKNSTTLISAVGAECQAFPCACAGLPEQPSLVFKQLAFTFLFLFHPLSSTFLFGFHYPVLSLFLCYFHPSNPSLFKLLRSKWPVTPNTDRWLPVCADFGASFSSCNLNWHVSKQMCQCACCPQHLFWKRAEIVYSHIFWQAQFTEQRADVTTVSGYGCVSDKCSIVGASVQGLQ